MHWEQEWIDDALDIVRVMYDDVYSTREPQHRVTVDVPKKVRGVL
jgi:hypothetical protein